MCDRYKERILGEARRRKTEIAEIKNPIEVQAAMARLALIAERSGLKERECQQWFMLQLKIYADNKLSKPMPKPIVFAKSNK